MPEGRMLKKVISESKSLGGLESDSSRLLYTWLIPFLDVAGRHSADPELIRGHIFPKVKAMTNDKIKNLLCDLSVAKLIILYKHNDELYLQFTKFKEHQKLDPSREAPSKIPAPIKKNIITCGPTLENSRPTQENSSISKVNVIKVNESKVNIIELLGKDGSSDSAFARQLEGVKDLAGLLAREGGAFRNLNLPAEFKKMAAWYEANPKRRKKNLPRFIHGWLARAGKDGKNGQRGNRFGADKETASKYAGIGETL